MSDTLFTKQRFRGCLLGGAVGDALGAPVEFLQLAEIQQRFGADGIREFAPAYGKLGAITDDTQMTLFTAEGVLRSFVRHATRGVGYSPSVIHRAYFRWLRTQGEKIPPLDCDTPDGWQDDGWLIAEKPLWFRRAPGNTCLSALQAARQMGAPATNDSKGCGGVMRAAPCAAVTSAEWAFELGCESAALTHGHPSGQLSAGFLACVINKLVAGQALAPSISEAIELLIKKPAHEEVLTAVLRAEGLAAQGGNRVEALGQGWVAEEALSISLFCALAAQNFETAVVVAVNHSGDSDSTGAITGNICGTLYGDEAIPARWLNQLELRDAIIRMADDLAALHDDTLELESERVRGDYPGW